MYHDTLCEIVFWFSPSYFLLPYTKSALYLTNNAYYSLVDFQTAYKMKNKIQNDVTAQRLSWDNSKKNPNLYYFHLHRYF